VQPFRVLADVELSRVLPMEETMPRVPYPYCRMILLCALSLSLGWGIRGNFGHEVGAMIPGALAAMAAVLMSAGARHSFCTWPLAGGSAS